LISGKAKLVLSFDNAGGDDAMGGFFSPDFIGGLGAALFVVGLLC